jgi:hypothetical protein
VGRLGFLAGMVCDVTRIYIIIDVRAYTMPQGATGPIARNLARLPWRILRALRMAFHGIVLEAAEDATLLVFLRKSHA